MILDVSPLGRHRDYRLLFAGQFVSAFGSMITYAAVPYQVFELTRSSLAVGMLGVVQLVPLVVFALWGGAYADAMDRRKLVIVSELLLTGASLALAVNSMLPRPGTWTLFAAMAENWGGAFAAGCLYAAMPAGTLILSLLSGWTQRVDRHGAAVVIAAAIWGAAILGLGFASTLAGAVVCLVLAGAADTVS